MARVSYAEADSSPEAARIFERQDRLGRNVTNFHRILARTPWILKWYIPFSQSVYNAGREGVLDQRLRQIAQIRTSVVNACAYCATHTSRRGTALGISDEEIAALHGETPLEGVFSSREIAALVWAEAVATNTARRDAAAYERLSMHFSEVEIVELTVLIAARTMVNRIQEALWTDLEAGGELPPRDGAFLPDTLEEYTRDILCRYHT